jgi:hypothetical protein
MNNGELNSLARFLADPEPEPRPATCPRRSSNFSAPTACPARLRRSLFYFGEPWMRSETRRLKSGPRPASARLTGSLTTQPLTCGQRSNG